MGRDHLEHAEIERVERFAPRRRDDDGAHGVVIAEHRRHHDGLARDHARAPVDHSARRRGVADPRQLLGVVILAVLRHERHLVARLRAEIEPRGVEPVLADELGDRGMGDLALGAGIRQPGGERSQEAHLCEEAVAGPRGDDIGRCLDGARLGRSAGSDELGRAQLVGPERARRAGRPHEMGDDPAADDKRRDQHRVAAVAGLRCLAVDVLDNRGQARLAEALQTGSFALPLGRDLATGRARCHDPCGIEAQKLPEEPARRVITQCGHRGDAAAGVCRRPGPRGAPRRGRRVTASEPWEHDSRQARPSAHPLASPERGNQAKIT